VDATHAYWIDNADGRVMKVALSGGDLQELSRDLFAPLRLSPSTIEVDETNAYWTSVGSIRKAPLAGGESLELVRVASSEIGLAVHRRWVHYTEAHWVKRVPAEGGPAVVVTEARQSPTEIAVDDTGVYGVSGLGASEDWIWKVTSLRNQQTIASNQYAARHLGVLGGSVYWLTGVNLDAAGAGPVETAVMRFDGSACQDGMCRCPAGQIVCGGACLDASRAIRDCGGCGAACLGRESCERGVCVAPPVAGTGGARGDAGSDASDAATTDATPVDAAHDAEGGAG
jgi:hypothetical protein